jgi:RND family efflux transporter MFP subunit
MFDGLRVLVGLSALSLGCEAVPEPQVTPAAVRVMGVQRASAAPSTRYSARIEPALRVDLAFKVGGYVDSIARQAGVDGVPRPIQEGDLVAAEAELASVRATDFTQRVREARAGFAQAAANLAQAKLDAARLDRLAGTGAAASADVESSSIRLEGARATASGAQARLDEALSEFTNRSLRSPIEGVVLSRAVEVGTLVTPGTVAFSIARIEQVKAMIGVPDTELLGVQLGSTQRLTTAAYPDSAFVGRITRIAPAADVQGRGFDIEITVPNPDGRLKVGMVASLALTKAASGLPVGAPVVPLTAVVRSARNAGQFAVFAVDGSEGATRVRAVEVVLGEYVGRVIRVLEGLAGNERIVVQGAGLLSDGERVEVIP